MFNWAGPLHTAHAGWLSERPHSLVRQRVTKRYGAIRTVQSNSNRTAEVHRPRRATPARQNPSVASGGHGRLTGAPAMVDNGDNDEVDDGDPPCTGSFSW